MDLNLPENIKNKISKLKINKTALIASLLGTTISFTLCTGCSKNNHIEENNIIPKSVGVELLTNDKDYKYDKIIKNENNIVEIPYIYKHNIQAALNKQEITVNDLLKIKSLTIIIRNEKNDLSWINYCKNLENLDIYMYTDGYSLNSINNLPNLKNINMFFRTIDNAILFDSKNLGFVKKMKKINSLNLIGIDKYRKNFNFNDLKGFINLDEINMYMYIDSKTHIDFKSLIGIKNLNINFGDSQVYDIAIFLDNDTIDILKSNNTNIFTNEIMAMKKVYKLNKKIDKIIESLDISKENDDLEKFNTILTYLLNNYNYNPKVLELSNNLSYDDKMKNEKYQDLIFSFYKKGLLYGAFKKNGNIICGNYASMFKALSSRVGLDSYYIINKVHAWNMVKIHNEYYYIDVTTLDVNITKNKGLNLETIKYLKNCLTDPKTSNNYPVYNIPVEYIIENNNYINDVNDITDKIIESNYANKTKKLKKIF